VKKTKRFGETRFSADVYSAAIERLRSIAEPDKSNLIYHTLSVQHDDATWEYDNLDEFLADYRNFQKNAHVHVRSGEFALMFWAWPATADITVTAPTRPNVESIFSIFESALAMSRVLVTQKPISKPIIFVGHGRSQQWRDLKDHFQDKHGYKVEAYETGARAGHSIRDILEELIEKSSFALLVLTKEDEQLNGEFRARQNVIHESGLFQGRLGFARAILLLEAGVEEFSNVQGVQYIRFSQGNIRETFGEVLATLRREFPADA
jgi:hypothetical protein